MKVKFNKLERVAGIFVVTALVGSIAATLGVAIQKGWFASKIPYKTLLTSAEGIHNGTAIQIAGLRAGTVNSVELVSNEEVLVNFEVFEKFKNRIKEDSVIQVVRPFVIGEKVFDITVGSNDTKTLSAGALIPTKSGFDLMDLFSGRKMAPFLGTINALATNLQVLAEAFADENRMKSFVELFDKLTPLATNMNTMSQKIINISNTMTEEQRLNKIVKNIMILTEEMNKVLPEMNKELPSMGKEISHLVSNLNELTSEFKKLTPAIAVVAPDLPRVSKRAIEGLDEMVITLKALQKSFLLRGNVEDVKEEENHREPAKEN